MAQDMAYKIGDVVGEVGAAAKICEGGGARWYALLTKPQKEFSAVAWLEVQGVQAWTPVEQRLSKRRGCNARRRYKRRIAPGYVFARFDGEPNWSHLFGDDPGAMYLRGVIGIAGRAIAIPELQMAEIARLPERLLRHSEEMLDAAEAAAKIAKGDRVRIKTGPFADFVVEVTSLSGWVACFTLTVFGRQMAMEMDTKNLDRLGSAEVANQ